MALLIISVGVLTFLSSQHTWKVPIIVHPEQSRARLSMEFILLRLAPSCSALLKAYWRDNTQNCWARQLRARHLLAQEFDLLAFFLTKHALISRGLIDLFTFWRLHALMRPLEVNIEAWRVGSPLDFKKISLQSNLS